MITHSYKLDMCPGGVPLAINLSQYDSDVQLVFELFASRGSFVLESGTTVAIRGTKPDGNGIDLDAAISDNVVTVSVTQQMTAVAGTSYYELTLYKGEKELNTAKFRLIIERAALDKDTLISGSEIRELVDIIDRTDEIIQAAADIQQTAEDLQEYVDAKEAEISQITTDAEETAQEALDEVTNVKNDLNKLTDDVYAKVTSKNLINPSSVTIGRLQADGTVNNAMYGYGTSDYILLEEGKTYVFAREILNSPGEAKITGYCGYGFYDMDKTWVANSRVWDNYSDNTNPPIFVITPESDCYIRVSGDKNYFGTDTTANFILQEGSALDGYEEYFEPYNVSVFINKDAVVQEHGASVFNVMSQKAVTDYVDSRSSGNIDELAPYVIGKNKYNPEECNPQNFYYYDANGAIGVANSYAITGKIPVEAETTYTFSATTYATQYICPYYFKGDSGETFISREGSIGVTTFTTPEECTFVAFNMFGRSHTEEDYNSAIAVAQLEEGSVPTAYEPYSEKRMISPDNIEGGDALSAVSEITATQSQVNLYDKSLAQDGHYFNGSSSVILTNTEWIFTGKIPVEPNRQYNLSIDPSSPTLLTTIIYCFDGTGNRLSNAPLSNYVYGYLLSFTTPADCKFVATNIHPGEHTTEDFNNLIATIMLCYGTQRPLTYLAYNPEVVVPNKKLSDLYFNPDCFKGKKWLATGTSITWYDSKTYSAGLNTGEICRGYVGNVARRKKLLVTNEGISGSTLANVSESSLINRYQSLDWAGTDIATLEYGVNDFGHAVDIGTADDAPGTDTFAACLKTVIEYALAQNPKLCLVICTEPDVRGTDANTNGHYLYEYTDVTIAIAKQYRLPVCDWFYHSGINVVTKGSSSVDYLTADGTHPNDAGHMRMGAMLNQVFDSLIC